MTDRELIQRHSRSFALAARLLPASARIRAEALYAWCRAADDRIDFATDQASALAALRTLHQEVDDVYSHRCVQSASAQALQRAVNDCGIPREYPEELLAGFEMDVNAVTYDRADELLLYCHRVAGVVGLMMCHALGVRDDAALPHAAHLGIAMQLTNIARDVAEDWQRGRRYLPAEWFSNCVPKPDEQIVDEQWAPAVRTCIRLAERYYQSGQAGLHYLAERDQLAIRTAARVYQAIGYRVSKLGCRPSAGRATVSPWEKGIILMSCVLAGVSSPFRHTTVVRPPRTVLPFSPLLCDDLLTLKEVSQDGLPKSFLACCDK